MKLGYGKLLYNKHYENVFMQMSIFALQRLHYTIDRDFNELPTSAAKWE